MEYNLEVKITIWSDGFTSDIKGYVHFVDSISHELRIEAQGGEFHRIAYWRGGYRRLRHLFFTFTLEVIPEKEEVLELMQKQEK